MVTAVYLVLPSFVIMSFVQPLLCGNYLFCGSFVFFIYFVFLPALLPNRLSDLILTFVGPVHRNIISIVRPTRCTKVSNLFVLE